MRVIHIASIFLAAIPVMATSAWAQSDQITVKLVPTIKSLSPSYPGLSMDFLGIRPGMPLAQAKAIATKTYAGKPQVFNGSLSFQYRGITAQSKSYVGQLRFGNQNKDQLVLTFSSPVSGNTVDQMYRDITFPGDILKDPLVSTVKASLIKKYGPPSTMQPVGETQNYYWEFSAKSLKHCKYQCMNPGGTRPSDAVQKGVVLAIEATIDIYGRDKTKASGLSIQLADFQSKNKDIIAATKQLKSAAVALYNKAKAPSAPKL